MIDRYERGESIAQIAAAIPMSPHRVEELLSHHISVPGLPPRTPSWKIPYAEIICGAEAGDDDEKAGSGLEVEEAHLRRKP